MIYAKKSKPLRSGRYPAQLYDPQTKKGVAWLPEHSTK